jgi:hypothetical protein
MGPKLRAKVLDIVLAVCAAGVLEIHGAWAIFYGNTSAAVAIYFCGAGCAIGAAIAWTTRAKSDDEFLREEIQRSARELVDRETFAGWRRHGRS